MLAVFLTLSFASGCAGTLSLDCAGWSKIEPAVVDVDVVSNSLARQIVAHNDFGRLRGCWE